MFSTGHPLELRTRIRRSLKISASQLSPKPLDNAQLTHLICADESVERDDRPGLELLARTRKLMSVSVMITRDSTCSDTLEVPSTNVSDYTIKLRTYPN